MNQDTYQDRVNKIAADVEENGPEVSVVGRLAAAPAVASGSPIPFEAQEIERWNEDGGKVVEESEDDCTHYLRGDVQVSIPHEEATDLLLIEMCFAVAGG